MVRTDPSTNSSIYNKCGYVRFQTTDHRHEDRPPVSAARQDFGEIPPPCRCAATNERSRHGHRGLPAPAHGGNCADGHGACGLPAPCSRPEQQRAGSSRKEKAGGYVPTQRRGRHGGERRKARVADRVEPAKDNRQGRRATHPATSLTPPPPRPSSSSTPIAKRSQLASAASPGDAVHVDGGCSTSQHHVLLAS